MLFQSTTEIYHPYPVLLTIPRYSYFLGSQEEKNKIQISLQHLVPTMKETEQFIL